MKLAIALMLAGLSAAAVQAAPPAKTKAHHAKPVSPAKTSAKAGTAQHLSASAKSHAGKSHAVRGRYAKSKARRAPGPSYQTHPDTARYQEIQKALADKGYFKGEPNGQWDNDSVDALKRFQADQSLDSDGKINARTLFGLGLGPKHDGSSVASALTPQTDVQTTTTPQ